MLGFGAHPHGSVWVPADSFDHEYSANAGVLTDGDGVYELEDQIGSDNLTQATGTKKPQVSADHFGTGIDGIQFDGIEDFLQGAFAGGAMTQPLTVMILWEWTTATANQNIWMFDGDDTTNRCLVRQNGDPAREEMYAGAFINSSASSNTAPHYGVFKFDSSGYIRIDGTETGSGNPGTTIIDGFTLGATHTGGSPGDITVERALIKDGALSGGDLASAEAWAATRLGL